MLLKVSILLAIAIGFTKGATKVDTALLTNLLEEIYNVTKQYKSVLLTLVSWCQ